MRSLRASRNSAQTDAPRAHILSREHAPFGLSTRPRVSLSLSLERESWSSLSLSRHAYAQTSGTWDSLVRSRAFGVETSHRLDPPRDVRLDHSQKPTRPGRSRRSARKAARRAPPAPQGARDTPHSARAQRRLPVRREPRLRKSCLRPHRALHQAKSLPRRRRPVRQHRTALQGLQTPHATRLRIQDARARARAEQEPPTLRLVKIIYSTKSTPAFKYPACQCGIP